MKRYSILLIILIQSVSLFAQKPNELRSASYYDSLTRTGDPYNVYNYRFLAGIYRRENRQPELKRTYERAIKCPLVDDR